MDTHRKFQPLPIEKCIDITFVLTYTAFVLLVDNKVIKALHLASSFIMHLLQLGVTVTVFVQISFLSQMCEVIAPVSVTA